MSLSISRVQIEHHREALGIGEATPRLSWRFEGDVRDWVQRSYEVEITQPSADPKTFLVESTNSLLVPWPGEALSSGLSTSVRVRAFGQDEKGDTDWSSPTTIEVGLLDRKDWKASLIRSTIPSNVNKARQPILFRRNFTQNKASVQKARLYITAQGVYEAHLNAKRVGDQVLAPGWTSYTHRLPYQTYDVTDLLREGENVISAQVAEGWYGGRLGFFGGNRNIWGKSMGLLAQLVITFQDATVQVIRSDSDWKTSTGSVITSEIYDGEVADLSLEPRGWQTAGFDDSGWSEVNIVELPAAELVAPDGPPIKKIEELKPSSIIKTPSGKKVIDFGQNLVGWVRLKLSGPRGRVITLLHTEVLENGEAATRPLRECKATDSITLSGEAQTWEPKFTFHGFRYVQIDGLPEEEEIDLATIAAVVVHNDMEATGWFETSNPLLNQLHRNIRWGMKGNFLSIPSDCPQRDERLGWTGDIHLFAPTANFLYDTCGMLSGWAKDLVAEQMADNTGIPPFFCPNVFLADPKVPTAIWGDVIVGLPWSLYQSYGDQEILRRHMESMEAWVHRGILRDPATGLWKNGSYQFGDWLDPKAPSDEPGNSVTDPLLVANAYLVHVTYLMQKIKNALGFDVQAEEYGASAKNLKIAFQNRYITNDGRVVADSQTGLTLAIFFGLFASEAQQSVAAERLSELILKNARFKIATGFAGTPLIGHALSRVGLSQLFYRMLYHRKVPNWLYQVTMGATTMWERWDGILPDGSVNPGEMTSFNHYALGSVADWMHSTIAGLTCLEPGWRRFRVAPVPGGDLEHANACFLSPSGLIRTGWKIEAGTLKVSVTVPPNATAEIVLPGESSEARRSVGSGVYEFEVEYKSPVWPPLPIYPDYYPHDDDEP